jgi:hypothetical protein
MLDVALTAKGSQSLAASLSIYVPADGNNGQRRYMLPSQEYDSELTQPREVLEMAFATPQQAVRALRRGEVDLVDRAFPAEIEGLRRDPQLTVIPYRVPSLHVLICNPLNPYLANPLFRRCLIYGINRQLILNRELLAGTALPGCHVISGPFSPGIDADDPLAYAYDARIEPRAYDPLHARTLLQLAQVEVEAAAAKGQQPTPELKRLTLFHPAHELARIACEQIAQDLKLLNIQCMLQELPPEKCRPADNAWDLCYVDYVISEPLVEARRLLAVDGLAGCTSPHLNLALRQLDRATNWNEVSTRLRAIHQICFDDSSLIPLWQLVDHLVCRPGIGGMVARPVTTYQAIETWNLHSAP